MKPKDDGNAEGRLVRQSLSTYRVTGPEDTGPDTSQDLPPDSTFLPNTPSGDIVLHVIQTYSFPAAYVKIYLRFFCKTEIFSPAEL